MRRRDVTDALADGFLSDSIKRIQRVMRVPAGEKSVQLTVDDDNYLDNGALAIPSDYLALKDITHTNGSSTRILKRQPLSVVLNEVENGAEGTCWCFARRGAAWVFGPVPVSDDVVRIDYYSEYEDASEDADETILLDIAEDLVVYGALSYACDHFADKRGQAFEARFSQILADIEAQGDDDELSGNAAVEQGFYYPSDD
jgi:hypothetical protein